MTQETIRHRAITRQRALEEFYAAERRLGVDPLTANERMHEFAKRFDKEVSHETST